MSARFKGKRIVTGKTTLSIQTQVNDQKAVNNKSINVFRSREIKHAVKDVTD